MHVQTNFMTFSDQREQNLDQEMLAYTHISRRRHAFDTELFNTKWFDYRFLTPFEATMKFVDEFQIVAREQYAANFSFHRAKHIWLQSSITLIGRLKSSEPKTKRAFSGFWRARQVADALGMPYRLYIDLAMTQRLRNWNRTYLPDPCQLYDDRDVEKVRLRWEEIQQATFHFSDHHAYIAQNYQGLQVQNDYHDFLFKQANESALTERHLGDFIRRDMLPPQVVRDRIGDEAYRRVMQTLN